MVFQYDKQPMSRQCQKRLFRAYFNAVLYFPTCCLFFLDHKMTLGRVDTSVVKEIFMGNSYRNMQIISLLVNKQNFSTCYNGTEKTLLEVMLDAGYIDSESANNERLAIFRECTDPCSSKSNMRQFMRD